MSPYVTVCHVRVTVSHSNDIVSHRAEFESNRAMLESRRLTLCQTRVIGCVTLESPVLRWNYRLCHARVTYVTFESHCVTLMKMARDSVPYAVTTYRET